MSQAAAHRSLNGKAVEVHTLQRPHLMLTVMLLSVFMAVANIFIVNVATPSIQQGLHSDFFGVQFVISAYTLAYAVALIIGGRIGDRFGRKKLLLVGVAGFTISSLLCGLSSGVDMLTAIRVVQGLSAAMISPQILSLIQAQYAPEQRGKIFGLYGATQGLAASTGQLIGGLLLYWNPWGLEWRMVFFFSVPIGLLLLCIIPFIAESKETVQSKPDWFGAVLIAVGLFLLVYPLVQGQKEGWPLALIISLLLSVPVLALFVWVQKRLLHRNDDPLMNVNLFRQRGFRIGMLVVFVLMSSQASFFLITAYLFQIGLGFSPLKAGAVILPMGLGYFIASLFSSRVTYKIGPHVLTVGSVLTAAGYLSLALTVRGTGISPDIYVWFPALAVVGIGQGFIAAPLTNVVLSKVNKQDIGSASGILTTGMQVAYAIGIALIGIVWLNSLNYNANEASIQTELQLRQQWSVYAPLTKEQSEAALSKFRLCYPEMINAHSSVSPGCTSDDSTAEKMFMDGVRQANARSYTASFIFCLYVLAAYTAFLLPLSLKLARRN
ncbi:MFS transporter [Paenibacillus spongiae]|uniref:MFS transporter n=1 Tax=Paenibacillus spongiae TaxID=2909671 RepID=A0ABY5SHE6_9BACL|nr:MFS transporter [Paenibacillus spongiae]UVI33426.1 MFS transporter [Paenibacillus spongiae]